MKTQVLSAKDNQLDAEALTRVVETLRGGAPVALPTETVYGLAANALDADACAAVFEAKGRPLSDPLIVHVPGQDWLEKIAEVSIAARELIGAFWPGPLTLVLPRKSIVPDIVTAGQPTVAVRQSAHPVLRQVLEAFGKPLAAPSANRFGRISPTTADHVIAELDGTISLVVDAGPCAHGIESTIVLVHGDGNDDGDRGKAEILREGPVTREMLREVTEVAAARADVAVPGALKSHYAPGTPLVIEADPDARRQAPARCGLLAWRSDGAGFERVERLSEKHDLREAAVRLFGALRRLDDAGLDLIVAEPVPEEGLGAAIMDRLRKAAG